jgi:hypothetical protein
MVQNSRLLVLSILAAVTWLPVARGDFIIDSFTSPVFTRTVSGVENHSPLPLTDTIGGARSINYNHATDTNGEINIQSGLLEFISRTNLTARVTIIWDGNANSTLDTTNHPVLPNDFGLTADFNTNHRVRFRIPFVTADGDAMIFRLYGASATNFLQWDRTLSTATVTGGFFDLDVLSEAPNLSSGTVSLSNIQAITMSLQPLGATVPTRIDFDFIEAQAPAAVPEPGTLGLLGTVTAAALTYHWRERRRNRQVGTTELPAL